MYPSAAVTAASPAPTPAATRDLRALLPDELTSWVAAAGAPAYRAEQIFRWLHGQGVETLDEMTNVPAALRAALRARPPAGAAGAGPRSRPRTTARASCASARTTAAPSNRC